MPDAVDAGPLGALQLKLPVIGRAVAGAIEKVTQDADRFVFALFVIDTATGGIVWTSDGERESFRAALSEFLSHSSH